jgi:hypothetical protein
MRIRQGDYLTYIQKATNKLQGEDMQKEILVFYDKRDLAKKVLKVQHKLRLIIRL